MKQKLNFRFHNPNAVDDTADYILSVFIHADKPKLDRAIQDACKDPSVEKAGVLPESMKNLKREKA